MITNRKLMTKLEAIEKKLELIDELISNGEVWKQVAQSYREHCTELQQALLARDLPELATYGGRPSVPKEPVPYDPRSDSHNAGAVMIDET